LKFRPVLGLFAILLVCGIQDALAASVNIVALGASWTYGSGKEGGRGSRITGVSENEAYPALLESLLNAKGIDAHVSNAGVPGDSTDGMYSRLNSAVPDGTQLVVLEIPIQHENGATNENIAKMVSALKARHIKVVILAGGLKQLPPALRDGAVHPNARGQAVLAARLLPKVIAALGHK